MAAVCWCQQKPLVSRSVTRTPSKRAYTVLLQGAHVTVSKWIYANLIPATIGKQTVEASLGTVLTCPRHVPAGITCR